MRRDQAPRRALAEMLLAAWRAAGDPRAAALEAGEAVPVSEAELPGDYRRPEPDRCLGYPDDYQLTAEGVLELSLEYRRRRLSEPHHEWRDGAWHEVPAIWRDGAWLITEET